MLDLLLPKPGEGIGSEIAVGKLYASILIQDCFRRFHFTVKSLRLYSSKIEWAGLKSHMMYNWRHAPHLRIS